MVKSLVKSGNSQVLVLSKEMLGQMGLEGCEVEVVPFQSDGFVVRRPRNAASFDTAVAETLAQYENAFKELAK